MENKVSADIEKWHGHKVERVLFQTCDFEETHRVASGVGT